MADYYIDAWYLALPSAPTDEAVCDRYVQDLVNLHEIVSESEFAVAVSCDLATLLAMENCYPLGDIHEDDSLWPQRIDIQKIVGQLLARIENVEDDDGVVAVLVSNVNVNPNPFPHDCSERQLEHRNELLIRALVHSNRLRHSGTPYILTKLDGHVLVTIQTAGRLEGWEIRTNHPEYAPPVDIDGAVRLCGDPSYMVLGVDPVDLILTGNLRSAINIAVHNELSGREPRWPLQRRIFNIGARFSRTMEDHGFFGDRDACERLIRAVVDTILDRRLGATHSIRISEGGGARDRIRANDGAAAMRRNIDYEYHLHYWRTGNGPEFSCIAQHRDLNIF